MSGLLPNEDNWRQACVWRAARILRFTDRRRDKRAWIRFAELAERYGRNIGFSEGYEQLRLAVIAGEFEREGRSRVLYLHPGVTRAKMTRERMASATATFLVNVATLERQYLGCCWIPRELAIAWCAARNVATVGWLDSDNLSGTPSRRGRRSIDDTAALRETRRLCAEGYSARDAATQAAALFVVSGNSTTAAADRLRKKLAHGLRK